MILNMKQGIRMTRLEAINPDNRHSNNYDMKKFPMSAHQAVLDWTSSSNATTHTVAA